MLLFQVKLITATAFYMACQLNKLQRVQNMCARLICNESKYCHITPLVVDLITLAACKV